MRYKEFKIAESKLDEVPDDGTRAGQQPNRPVDAGLQAGPPYPPAQMNAVKDMQRKLQDAGYSVGSTGIDGKYGPRTQRAVAAFKKDYASEVGDAIDSSMTADNLEVLGKIGNEIQRVARPTPIPQNGVAFNAADIAALGFNGPKNDEAKTAAEEYLGRELSADEWNALVRATVAEASPNQQEQAAVMAVILNRVRAGHGGGQTVTDVLYQTNQFQAVTGTPRDRSPSRNYTNPSPQAIASVADAAIKYLSGQNRSWMNFTSNNPAAYGPGTNLGFLSTMRNSPGSQVIGGTVFGTA